LESGLATRIGDTHRFQFTSDGNGEGEQILLTALWEFGDLTAFPAPVVVAGVHFRDRGANAVMCTPPNDRSASLPAADLLEIRFGPGANPPFGIETLARRVTGGFLRILLEVTPA
jgi:hypothetical protein